MVLLTSARGAKQIEAFINPQRRVQMRGCISRAAYDKKRLAGMEYSLILGLIFMGNRYKTTKKNL
jgi:hypothetical protein